MAGDFLECLPELIFEADARFVTSNDNRPLDNRGFHPSLSMFGPVWPPALPLTGSADGFCEAWSPPPSSARSRCIIVIESLTETFTGLLDQRFDLRFEARVSEMWGIWSPSDARHHAAQSFPNGLPQR